MQNLGKKDDHSANNSYIRWFVCSMGEFIHPTKFVDSL